MRFILIFLIMGSLFAQDDHLTIEKQEIQKELLKGKIFKRLTPLKADYVDEKDRGTVVFLTEKINVGTSNETLKHRNYCFYKVEISDGTTIQGVNFNQEVPHTNAIKGKNLTFIECNLRNVVIDETWVLINCLTMHGRIKEKKIGGTTYKITEVEKNGEFVEVDREEIFSDNIID